MYLCIFIKLIEVEKVEKLITKAGKNYESTKDIFGTRIENVNKGKKCILKTFMQVLVRNFFESILIYDISGLEKRNKKKTLLK